MSPSVLAPGPGERCRTQPPTVEGCSQLIKDLESLRALKEGFTGLEDAHSGVRAAGGGKKEMVRKTVRRLLQ